MTPSRLADAMQARIERVTAEAVGALGLREGPVHAELRIDGTDVRVIEVAARSIGGLCARTLRFGAGIALEELVLRHALGLPTDGLTREPAASGVMMLPIPRAGVLAAVRGQEDARSVPGIVGLELTINPGRPVRPLPEGDRYLGFLFARAATPEAVETCAARSPRPARRRDHRRAGSAARRRRLLVVGSRGARPPRLLLRARPSTAAGRRPGRPPARPRPRGPRPRPCRPALGRGRGRLGRAHRLLRADAHRDPNRPQRHRHAAGPAARRRRCAVSACTRRWPRTPPTACSPARRPRR